MKPRSSEEGPESTRTSTYGLSRNKAESRADSFKSNLTYFVDPLQTKASELNTFKGATRSQWQKVKMVNFRTRELAYCCICLEKNFTAPQITHCGHLFCWHCLYMHHYRSFKANNCPVCNQFFVLEELVSCRPIQLQHFKQHQKNILKLSLRCKKKNDHRIFNPQTQIEEVNFSRVVKITRKGLKNIYQEQISQILKAIEKAEDDQVKDALTKVLNFSENKVYAITVADAKYQLLKYQKLVDQTILHTLNSKQDLTWFYQQASGRPIYLHNISFKYLKSHFVDSFPNTLEEEILIFEESQYTSEFMSLNKELNHLTPNQEIDFVIINLQPLLTESLHINYKEQLKLYKSKKIKQQESQEKQAERLRIIYQKDKEYREELKRMTQSQFQEVYLPPILTNMDEINNHQLFPSLISEQTKIDETKKEIKEEEIKQIEIKQQEIMQEKGFRDQLTLTLKTVEKQLKISPKAAEEQFPKLQEQSQEQEKKNTKPKQKAKGEDLACLKKRKNQKKKQFVDVTKMFFKHEDNQKQ